LRQSVTAINSPRPFGTETDSAAAAGTTPDSQVPSATGAAGVGASPKKLLDGAMADFWAGQYDLAAIGLESYVKSFPQSPEAPDAQLHAANSYLQAGKNDKAVEAYDVAIRTYPKSNVLPEVYAKKGLALMNLKQYDKAREALEYCIKTFPADNPAVIFAQQRLKEIPSTTAPPKR
jgi:TolA-binding protein